MNDAFAQTLTAAAPPADFTWLWIALAFAVFVGIAIYLHRRFPTQAAKTDAAVRSESVKLLAEIRDKIVGALAVPPRHDVDAPASEPAPTVTVSAGKSGQAGPLTIQCSGDPAADIKAFNAAYFGP